MRLGSLFQKSYLCFRGSKLFYHLMDTLVACPFSWPSIAMVPQNGGLHCFQQLVRDYSPSSYHLIAVVSLMAHHQNESHFYWDRVLNSLYEQLTLNWAIRQIFLKIPRVIFHQNHFAFLSITHWRRAVLPFSSLEFISQLFGLVARHVYLELTHKLIQRGF